MRRGQQGQKGGFGLLSLFMPKSQKKKIFFKKKGGSNRLRRRKQIGGFYDAFRAKQTNQLRYLYRKKKNQKGSSVKPRKRTVGKIPYSTGW